MLFLIVKRWPYGWNISIILCITIYILFSCIQIWDNLVVFTMLRNCVKLKFYLKMLKIVCYFILIFIIGLKLEFSIVHELGLVFYNIPSLSKVYVMNYLTSDVNRIGAIKFTTAYRIFEYYILFVEQFYFHSLSNMKLKNLRTIFLISILRVFCPRVFKNIFV